MYTLTALSNSMPQTGSGTGPTLDHRCGPDALRRVGGCDAVAAVRASREVLRGRRRVHSQAAALRHP